MSALPKIAADTDPKHQVTGISQINHKIRLQFEISITEYVILDFITHFHKKYPKDIIQPADVWENIGITMDVFIPLCDRLLNIGLIRIAEKRMIPDGKWFRLWERRRTPTKIEVVNYFTENGYHGEIGAKAFSLYDTPNADGKTWVDTKGNTIKDWKRKMVMVWFRPEYKIGVYTPTGTTAPEAAGKKIDY